MTLDTVQCFQQGCTGAFGAVPGTLAAHPLDLVKIRLQLGQAQAFRRTLVAPWAGVVPGIYQKVVTRGPMFFLSEVVTQLCQKQTGWSRPTALFVGSAASGFATGFLAAPAEWAKVQRGTVNRQSTVRILLLDSIRSGNATSMLRRMRGAGLRNAVFDSTFFGTEHALRTKAGMPHGVSYAMAAAFAVFVDYPLDVAVKRSMAVGAREMVPGPLSATYRLLLHDAGRLVFRGIGWKGMEFSVSYFVTGCFAPLVAAGFVAASGVWTRERS